MTNSEVPPQRRRICPKDPTTVGILDSDAFCWQCGAALEWGASVRCPCGHGLAKADHFCPKCGRRVEGRE